MSTVSKAQSRVGRVLAMDRRELLDRLRQSVTARVDWLRYRCGLEFVGERRRGSHDISLGRFFFTSAEVPALCAELKQVFPSPANEIVSRAQRICQHRFDLLGYENLDYGPQIDWHCDVVHGKRGLRKPFFKVKYLDFDEVGDSKITWELNRHQHFVTLAKAYRLTGDGKFAEEIFAEWQHWHKENPYPLGMNWASSLEVGYRSLSWIWTFFLLQECPVFTTEMRQQWLNSLSRNGSHLETYLSTYFSPNTHLLGEALALFFIGTLFPDLRRAGHWRRVGWEILQREAPKQVRQDGFYFEQSIYYHVYALDIFLHAATLAKLNDIPISAEFDQILQRMLNALLLLGRVSAVPRIGDDDGGRLFDGLRNRAEHMLDPLATGAVLYQRGDFKVAAGGPTEELLWLLGVKGLEQFDSLADQKPSGSTLALRESGFYLISDEDCREQLIIDAGPLGTGNGGHGHADALSVCLMRDGRSLLIDPGTFEYVGESGERARFRGTSAHNSMQVDGQDQAEITGPFSWRNPPQVKVEQWINGRQFDLFQGSHDGYSRLPSPVIHRRCVFRRKGAFWFVCDLAEGQGSHELEIAWHLAPTLSPVASSKCEFADHQGGLAFLTPANHGWSQSVRRDCWSPAYGQKERASTLSFAAEAELPVDFATLLITTQPSQLTAGQLTKRHESPAASVCGYHYSNPMQEHDFFLARRPGSWSLEAWNSDARFVYWSFDREKEQFALILCDGSYADFDGRRVLTCGKRVSYAEVLSSAANIEMFSSDLEQVVLHTPLDRINADAKLIVPGDGRNGMRV